MPRMPRMPTKYEELPVGDDSPHRKSRGESAGVPAPGLSRSSVQAAPQTLDDASDDSYEVDPPLAPVRSLDRVRSVVTAQMEAAATKIQARARGRMARRAVEALREGPARMWRPFTSELRAEESAPSRRDLQCTSCAVYDDPNGGGPRALLGETTGKLSVWDLQRGERLHELDAHGCEVTHCKVLSDPSLAFGKPKQWPSGWSGDSKTENSLIYDQRFQPVTSEPLRKKGAHFYCWLYPGEGVTPARIH